MQKTFGFDRFFKLCLFLWIALCSWIRLRKNNILFFEVSDLVDGEYYSSRLPDGHPSAILNYGLAVKIKEKVRAALEPTEILLQH